MPDSQQDHSSIASAGHKFPWELILRVCELSDVSTLVQLCLVSFGMLGRAGPLLYEHVELDTVAGLRGFFFEPSLVPSASRLRPLLGPDLTRNLDLDLHHPAWLPVLTRSPLPEWEWPKQRVSSPIHIKVLTLQASPAFFQKYMADTLVGLVKIVRCEHEELNCIATPLPPQPDTLDMQLDIPPYQGISSTSVRRFSGVKIEKASLEVEAFLTYPEPVPLKATFDLRRLGLTSATISTVYQKAVLSQCLGHVSFWDVEPEGNVAIKFLVGSAKAERAVKKSLELWPNKERTQRCQVVRC